MAIVSGITKVPEAKLSPDTDLKLELNVDSLQGLQIVAASEKHFEIIIPDEELDMYTSIRLIVEIIKEIQFNYRATIVARVIMSLRLEHSLQRSCRFQLQSAGSESRPTFPPAATSGTRSESCTAANRSLPSAEFARCA